jgi:hypothetical protein
MAPFFLIITLKCISQSNNRNKYNIFYGEDYENSLNFIFCIVNIWM